MTLNLECQFCDAKKQIEISVDAYMRWQMGELIQDAFPELSAADREFLRISMCPDCFEHIHASLR